MTIISENFAPYINKNIYLNSLKKTFLLSKFDTGYKSTVVVMNKYQLLVYVTNPTEMTLLIENFATYINKNIYLNSPKKTFSRCRFDTGYKRPVVNWSEYR